MKTSKCTSCGANIEAYRHNGTYACPYCGTIYTQEESLVQQTTHTNSPTLKHNNQTFQQKVETPKQDIPERPKISLLGVLVLFYFGLFPALFYIGIIKYQQREWDKKYNKD